MTKHNAATKTVATCGFDARENELRVTVTEARLRRRREERHSAPGNEGPAGIERGGKKEHAGMNEAQRAPLGFTATGMHGHVCNGTRHGNLNECNNSSERRGLTYQGNRRAATDAREGERLNRRVRVDRTVRGQHLAPWST